MSQKIGSITDALMADSGFCMQDMWLELKIGMKPLNEKKLLGSKIYWFQWFNGLNQLCFTSIVKREKCKPSKWSLLASLFMWLERINRVQHFFPRTVSQILAVTAARGLCCKFLVQAPSHILKACWLVFCFLASRLSLSQFEKTSIL